MTSERYLDQVALLVRVLPEWQAQSLPIHAVWAAGKLRGKAKLFADHVAERLKDMEKIC